MALRLLRLATPISFSLGAGASIALVDSLLVAPVGAAALAAIALGGSVTLVIIASIYGLMSMVGVRLAEADARSKSSVAASEFTSGLVLASLAGGAGGLVMLLTWPLLSIAGQPQNVLDIMGPYWALSSISLLPMSIALAYRLALEAFERVWLGTALVGLTVMLNAGFGIILVHGYFGLPALDLTGAGLATFLANLTAVFVSRIAVHRARLDALQFLGKHFSWTVLRAQTWSGAPAGLQYLLETGAGMVAMFLVGLFGTVALAANQIVSAVAMTVYMIPLGVAAATGLAVARLRGEGRTEDLRRMVVAALTIVTGFMGSAAMIFWGLGAEIAAVFSNNPAVVSTAASIFVVFACMQVLDGIQSVTIGALRGFHDVGTPAIITVVFLWLVGLPTAMLMGLSVLNSPSGVWVGVTFGLLIASFVLLRRIWRTVLDEQTDRSHRQIDARS